jgi:hypothetical protein
VTLPTRYSCSGSGRITPDYGEIASFAEYIIAQTGRKTREKLVKNGSFPAFRRLKIGLSDQDARYRVSKIAGDWKFGQVVESKGHERIIGVVTDQPGNNAGAVWLQAQLLLALARSVN